MSALKLVGDHLLIGFQGGHTLLLTTNNQTADRTIIVRERERREERVRLLLWEFNAVICVGIYVYLVTLQVCECVSVLL